MAIICPGKFIIAVDSNAPVLESAICFLSFFESPGTLYLNTSPCSPGNCLTTKLPSSCAPANDLAQRDGANLEPYLEF